jgi:hypothetical protein
MWFIVEIFLRRDGIIWIIKFKCWKMRIGGLGQRWFLYRSDWSVYVICGRIMEIYFCLHKDIYIIYVDFFLIFDIHFIILIFISSIYISFNQNPYYGWYTISWEYIFLRVDGPYAHEWIFGDGRVEVRLTRGLWFGILFWRIWECWGLLVWG